MEAIMAPLDERVGRTAPIFACFDPAPTAYRQARTFFGFNEDHPSIGKVRCDGFEREFTILSMF